MRRNTKRNQVLLLMILPAVLYFIIFAYIPMTGIVLAFKNYRFDLVTSMSFLAFSVISPTPTVLAASA